MSKLKCQYRLPLLVIQQARACLQPLHPQIKIKYTLYTDGQSVSSSMRVEPFDVLFWALSIVLAHILQQVTQLAGLAPLNHGTGTLLYSLHCTAGVSQIQLDRRRIGPFPFPIQLYYLSMPLPLPSPPPPSSPC